MSQLQQLLESSNQYKSLQSDAARLASKWVKTGLLEGLGSESDKSNMSMILENQAKQLVNEGSTTGGVIVTDTTSSLNVTRKWLKREGPEGGQVSESDTEREVQSSRC